MSTRMCVAVLAGLLAVSPLTPAMAQSTTPDDPQEKAEELARESLETLLRALDAMLEAVPQYDLPEITEDGDIIIRRRRPGEELEPPGEGAPDDDDIDEI